MAYLTFLNPALRSGEVWGVQPRDLKKERSLLHIARQWHRIDMKYKLSKYNKKRFVPLSNHLERELTDLIIKRGLAPNDPVFGSIKGRPVHHDNFAKRVFKPDVLDADVTVISPHSLRHTGITLMIANGIDLKTVQEIAGHSDLNTTQGYAHVVAKNIQEASRFQLR